MLLFEFFQKGWNLSLHQLNSKNNGPVLLLNRVHTILKCPWNLGEVLEKSLNSILPWKVLKFLCKSLKSPWIFFNCEFSGMESVFCCFLFSNSEYESWLRAFKVIYTKCSMCCAIINYQFKTDKWTEKFREVGEANRSSLRAL